MYVAGMLGLALGSMDASFVVALAGIILFLGIRAGYQILWPGELLGDGPSHYERYLANLAERGPLPPRAWLGFAIQLLVFGSLTGTLTFIVATLFL